MNECINEVWEIDGPVAVNEWCYICVCEAGDTRQVALVLDEGDGKGEARARLIAAAPELLAACEETATAIHTYQERGSHRDREDLNRCWQTMRLAIAKATQHTGD